MERDRISYFKTSMSTSSRDPPVESSKSDTPAPEEHLPCYKFFFIQKLITDDDYELFLFSIIHNTFFFIINVTRIFNTSQKKKLPSRRAKKIKANALDIHVLNFASRNRGFAGCLMTEMK